MISKFDIPVATRSALTRFLPMEDPLRFFIDFAIPVDVMKDYFHVRRTKDRPLRYIYSVEVVVRVFTLKSTPLSLVRVEVKKPIVERLVSCRSFHTVRGFQYCRLVAWPPRGRLPNLRILVRSFLFDFYNF